MKIRIVGLLVFIAIILFIPYNDTRYIADKSGEIRISRIERKSILINYGTFLAPEKYTNVILMPETYINPWYVDAGPFDDGCFELYAEFKGDTTIMYQGSYCKAKNLTSEFQLVEVPNAFGEKNWFSISGDKTGRYLHIDCATGLN